MMKRGISMFLAVAALAVGVWMVPGQAGAVTISTNIGNEGCSPGYWKNHTSNWQEYRTTTPLSGTREFTFPSALASYRTKTFLEALNFKGGSGVDGATQILMRAAVAAYLNAAHEGVGYPYRRFHDPFNIQSQVNAALAGQNRTAMLALAGTLDTANNLGCPLN